MNNQLVADKLDQAIDQVLAVPSSDVPDAVPSSLGALVEIARELTLLPRPEFKSRLRLEMEWQSVGRSMTIDEPHMKPAPSSVGATHATVPTFNRASMSLYPLRRTNVVASAFLHAAVLLALGMGLLAVHRAPQILTTTADGNRIILSAYRPEKGKGGGDNGGGGSHDPLNASKGALPPSSNSPFSAPIVQIQARDPKLPVRPSVIAPPDLNLPHTAEIGDPLSTLVTPSGGPGVRGGIGAGDRGGIGDGSGPHVGTGFGSGTGLTWPRAIYHPEPEFSEEARREHYQGVVALLIVVGSDGRAHDIRILRALGMGLDEKAMEAVRTWRFDPGTKDGRPVPVLMEVDVDFRIH